MATKSPIDADLIRTLAAILNETDLTEIEVEQKDLRVRVARQITVTAQVAAPPIAAAPVKALPDSAADGPVSVLPAGAITSPMVGTAYRAASPDKPNFIEVGANVRAGQTLLLIEAMKTYNEIQAPRDGVVSAILVESGDPVEYGQPLVVLA